MAKNQHETHATPLWNHFETVINWVKNTFPKTHKVMENVDWGALYKAHGKRNLDPKALQAKVTELMKDDEVTSKAGIFQYALDGKEKHLSIRTFTDSQKETQHSRQDGVCPLCKERFAIAEMEADHITPWSEGGKTDLANCQMLCKDCNRRKGSK